MSPRLLYCHARSVEVRASTQISLRPNLQEVISHMLLAVGIALLSGLTVTASKLRPKHGTNVAWGLCPVDNTWLTCQCGAPVFRLHKDGSIVCAFCGCVAGDWMSTAGLKTEEERNKPKPHLRIVHAED